MEIKRKRDNFLYRLQRRSLDAMFRNRPDFTKSDFARLRQSVKGDLVREAVNDAEYIALIEDILLHEEFQRLKQIRHHDSNIYNHSIKVSYVSYKACIRLGCDYRAAARGGLLHDFFHYDWKKDERPYKGGFHAFRHPRVALDTAERFFNISPVEKDIIIKHMWPLTMRAPRYRESMIVSMLDKYVASCELMGRSGKSLESIHHSKTPNQNPDPSLP